MQLAENFPDLTALYGQGPLAGYMGMDQTIHAKKSQGLNQQAALEDLLYNQQARPERVRGLQLQNQTTEAQLPGVQADSWQKQRNKQVREGINLSDEQRAEMSKLVTQMSDDEWKQEENAFNTALRSPNAAVRQKASELLPYLKEFQFERQKHQNRLAEIQATGANQQATANIRAAAPSRVGGVNALEKALVSGNPLQVAAAYDQMAQRADEADEQQHYLRKAQEYRAIAQQQDIARNPGAAPGRPNMGSMGIPVNPPAPPVEQPIVRNAPKPAANLPSPKTQAEYDVIPKGSKFIDTDGKEKVKK